MKEALFFILILCFSTICFAGYGIIEDADSQMVFIDNHNFIRVSPVGKPITIGAIVCAYTDQSQMQVEGMQLVTYYILVKIDEDSITLGTETEHIPFGSDISSPEKQRSKEVIIIPLEKTMQNSGILNIKDVRVQLIPINDKYVRAEII